MSYDSHLQSKSKYTYYGKSWNGEIFWKNQYGWTMPDFTIVVEEVFSDKEMYKKDLEWFATHLDKNPKHKEKWYSKFNKPVRR